MIYPMSDKTCTEVVACDAFYQRALEHHRIYLASSPLEPACDEPLDPLPTDRLSMTPVCWFEYLEGRLGPKHPETKKAFEMAFMPRIFCLIILPLLTGLMA